MEIKKESKTPPEIIRSLRPVLEINQMWRLGEELDERKKPKFYPNGVAPFQPLCLEEWLGTKDPIELEIGCGKGTFLVAYAEKHPQLPLIGIEWEPSIAFHAAKRLGKRPTLSKARVLLGDSFYFIRDFLPNSCVQAVHMYFPDPWPKKRHLKNRLLKKEFLDLLTRVCLPKSKFFWGTDHLGYHTDSQDILNNHPSFKLLVPDAEPTESIQTNFEIKYRAESRPIYRQVWEIN